MQDPLVTAFATANLFIVLPLIQERARQILEEASVPAEDASEAVDVLVPTSFTFPQSAAAVVPTPSLGSVPIAVMVPRGEENLLDLVNAAVEVADADGLLGRKLDYWVHGEGTRAEMGPRWSIARDLLGWWQDRLAAKARWWPAASEQGAVGSGQLARPSSQGERRWVASGSRGHVATA